jgi:hypothetical protein
MATDGFVGKNLSAKKKNVGSAPFRAMLWGNRGFIWLWGTRRRRIVEHSVDPRVTSQSFVATAWLAMRLASISHHKGRHGLNVHVAETNAAARSAPR